MPVRELAGPQGRWCGGRGRGKRGAAALGGPPRPHPHPAPLPPGSAVPPPGGRRHCTAPVRPATRGDPPAPRRGRSITRVSPHPPSPGSTLVPLPRSEPPSCTRSAPGAAPLDPRSARSAVETGEAAPEADPRGAAADLCPPPGAALPGAAARCRRPPRDGSGGGGGETGGMRVRGWRQRRDGRRAGRGMGADLSEVGRGGVGHGERSGMGIGAGIG